MPMPATKPTAPMTIVKKVPEGMTLIAPLLFFSVLTMPTVPAIVPKPIEPDPAVDHCSGMEAND